LKSSVKLLIVTFVMNSQQINSLATALSSQVRDHSNVQVIVSIWLDRFGFGFARTLKDIYFISRYVWFFIGCVYWFFIAKMIV